MRIDEALIRQADALATGANVHELAFMVAAYKSLGCPEAETFLRSFVATGCIYKAREAAKQTRHREEPPPK